MKFKILLLFISILSLQSFAQSAKNVLFTIDNEPFYTDEFMRTYQKNQHIVEDSNNNSIGNYLKLFVDYKLKVKSAKDAGLDTLKSYKTELNQYRNSLILPYLKDEAVTNELVAQAYERLLIEINASHILILANADALPADTIAAYNNLIEARNSILNGADFKEIAKQVSQDPSVQQNGGEIGYFTALQMVYPFENVAYTTPKGEVSQPFRTKFGFHILKVNNIRPSKGEVEVAHIMIRNSTPSAEIKIDSIYNVVLGNPDKFEEMAIQKSEDNASAANGGKLRRFSSGQMIEEFSEVAFSLQTNGEISKPFQTTYGWHIIKLLQKYPIESFEELKPKLLQQVENNERSNLIGKSVVDKLSKQYLILVNETALNQFEIDDWKTTPEKFQQKLLSIENEDIYQATFINYLKTLNNVSPKLAFNTFKETKILDYYKANIQYSNAEFAATYKEFEDGLLLFEMLEKQVWDKSKDSVGLSNFYENNKANLYKNIDFENNRGLIISDYQNHLEKEWVKSLHQQYKVVFNKEEKDYILEAKLD
jgi:peptidyl-prolyl cis-trans isomerase SurA